MGDSSSAYLLLSPGHKAGAFLQARRIGPGVDEALAEVEWQLADARLRLDPKRDQAGRAAEAIKREKEAEELKQTTDEFVDAAARLAETLRQLTAVSSTATEASSYCGESSF